MTLCATIWTATTRRWPILGRRVRFRAWRLNQRPRKTVGRDMRAPNDNDPCRIAAQACLWGLIAAVIGRVASPQHHHYSAPNRSRLGVSISGFRRRRGVRGHSACADGRRTRGHDAPGSPLFRSLFSRNLRQLPCRGTRTRPSLAVIYARAAAIGCPANLEQQCITPTRPPRRASSTSLRVAA